MKDNMMKQKPSKPEFTGSILRIMVNYRKINKQLRFI
ncbi:Uncharacterised protein [Mycobacteroides abscessus subsp. abscessus]|nr:Uncharacterised protein [Mycobacteroides abscessus subsp. abscessus]